MRNMTTRPDWLPARRIVLAAAAIGLFALAGCSSGGGSTDSSPAADNGNAGSATTTVMIDEISGASVLTNADGRTLYVNDQEDGTVLCTSSDCIAIWLPVTVPNGETPTGPSQLKDALGTMMRPDGETQVTLNDQPLYTFSFDHASGEVNGDSVGDSFDGIDYIWQKATSSGDASVSSTPAPSDNGGYGY